MLCLFKLLLDLRTRSFDRHEAYKLLNMHFLLLFQVLKHLPQSSLIPVAFGSTVTPVLLLVQDLHERDPVLYLDITLFKDGV